MLAEQGFHVTVVLNSVFIAILTRKYNTTLKYFMMYPGLDRASTTGSWVVKGNYL